MHGGGATPANGPGTSAGVAPDRAGWVLASLILVAAVANLNLSVANVALPEIGDSFDASQTALDLIAVGFSLGLAASVLWFGALGDRYGRKMMVILGMSFSIPASLIAALAPSEGVLFLARVGGGVAAGMAYPTTLALITALWSGQPRTRAIALWSALGGGFAMLGPLVSGILLDSFDWGAVFLVTLPLVAVALPMAIHFVPKHVDETSDPVDNLGGLLSALFIGALIVAINFLPVPNEQEAAIGLLIVAVAVAGLFYFRQRRAKFPLYDLGVAGRRTFWVAACAGLIVFGSMMGVAFVGQQYLQNVLGYSTVEAGAAVLPVPIFMVLVAPRSARLVASRGARFTLLCGYTALLASFIWMLLFWKEDISYWQVALAFALAGIGVGLAGTPASHSLTGSVPVRRVGMASGTADLQRDLGGALMTSVFGALLTAGYASAMGTAISESGKNISQSTQAQLQLSFASAENLAKQNPAFSNQITAAAQSSFVDGDQWAYLAGALAVLLGAALVWFFFPKKEAEEEMLARFHAQDAGAEAGPAPPSTPRRPRLRPATGAAGSQGGSDHSDEGDGDGDGSPDSGDGTERSAGSEEGTSG